MYRQKYHNAVFNIFTILITIQLCTNHLTITTKVNAFSSSNNKNSNSWQKRLDRALLDIDLTPEQRVRNFQRAVQDPTVILQDVQSAVQAIQEKGFGKGHPDFINTLWPEGTIARNDLEGLNALRTQLPEVVDEIRNLNQNQRQRQQQQNVFNPPNPPTINDLPNPKEIEEELKNALRSTPKGLETPQYNVVRILDGKMNLGAPEKIEIRQYEAFTVASTPSTGGVGFNTLASYLFGSNKEKKAMSMTTPVIIEKNNNKEAASGDDDGMMSFVIPKQDGTNPPVPLDAEDVKIDYVPERYVAVKAFPGLVTKEETSRQTQSLLETLSSYDEEGDDYDGFMMKVVNEDEVSVLQYNSPFTIPWRRRNEIAIVVEVLNINGKAGEEEKVNEVSEESEESNVVQNDVDEDSGKVPLDDTVGDDADGPHE